MTFPTVRSLITGSPGSTTIPYPATVSKGDILLSVNYIAGLANSTPDSGWTLLEYSAGVNKLKIHYKIAAGTEGGTTYTAAQGAAYSIVYSINAGSATAAPEISAATQTTVDTPTQPTLSPSWGAQDTLVICAVVQASGGSIFTAPVALSGYTQDFIIDLAPPVTFVVARATSTASSISPGTWTDSDAATAAFRVATIGIRYTPLGGSLFFGSNF